MSIDTTVKVGFDGSAVKGGLKNIGGMFGKFSKEVGIGAARKVGEFGADIAGKVVDFFATAPGQYMDYIGDLKDLSTASRETFNNLQILKRVFEMTGASGVDASKMIFTLTKAIGTAKEEAESGVKGPMLETFDALGVSAFELMNSGIVDQIRKIFAALNAPGFDKDKIPGIMSNLLGRASPRMMTGLGENLEANIAQAEEDVGSLLKLTTEQINGSERLGDVLSLMPLTKIKVFSNILNGIFGTGAEESAASMLQKLFNTIDKAGAQLENFGKSVRELFGHYGDIGFEASIKEIWTWLVKSVESLGNMIGTAIANGLTKFFEGTAWGKLMEKANALNTPNAIEGFKYVPPRSTGEDLMSMFKSAPSANNPKTNFTSDIVKPLIDSLNVQQSTLRIMEQIYREEGGAAFQ